MKRFNLHIFLTPCTHESRFLKESKSLVDARLFDEIMIAAIREEGLNKHESIDAFRSIWRIDLKSRKFPKNLIFQVIKYIEWLLHIAWGVRRRKIDVIQCHSLSAMPVGVLLKIFRRARLIYDAHELETEVDGMTKLRKYLACIFEKCLIRFADAIIVVSDSIADWYQTNYKMRRPTVIKNVPVARQVNMVKSKTLKEIYNINESDLLFIYQGGIEKGRGVERLLRLFAQVKNDRHIVFMGYGSLEGMVKEYERNHSSIHYKQAVAPHMVLEYTSSADVGIYLMENTCLNNYYSLPNKLFEYLMGCLPIMITDLPEQRKLIERFRCGWIASDDDDAVINTINTLGKEDIEEKRKYVQIARKSFGWENEEKILINLYKNIMDLT